MSRSLAIVKAAAIIRSLSIFCIFALGYATAPIAAPPALPPAPDANPTASMSVPPITAVAAAATPVAPTAPSTAAAPELRENTPLPTVEELNARIKSLQDDASLAAELKAALVETLTELVKLIPEINQQQTRRDALAAAAAAAPIEMAKGQAAKSAPSVAVRSSQSHPKNLAEVRAQKQEFDSHLEANLQQQQAIENELRKREERRKVLPQLLVDARTRVQKLEAEPLPVADPNQDPRLFNARLDVRRAKLKFARSELATLQQENKTYDAEADLLPLRRELLARDVQPLKEESQRLASLLATERSYDIESLRLKLQSHAQNGSTREMEEARKTLDLLNQWAEVVRDSVKMEERVAKAKTEAASIAKELDDIRKKIDPEQPNSSAVSGWVGLYLQRKREQLPNVTELRRDLLVQQEQIEKTESLLAGVNTRLDELRGASLVEQTNENPLLNLEREALEKMKNDLDKYVTTFFSLSAERENMIKNVVMFKELVDAQLLWMRSAAPIQASDLPDAWRAFQIMVHPEYLRELREATWKQFYGRMPLGVVWIIGTVGLYFVATRLRRRLHQLGDLASKRNATQMRPTWLALVATSALALPLVFALAVPGLLLSASIGVNGYVHAVGHGLIAGALFLLPLEMLRQIARPNGLGVSHFGWPDEIAQPLRLNLRWMIDLGIPLVIAWAATEQQRDSRDNVVSLTRLLFTTLMIVVSIILWRVMHPSYGVLHQHLLHKRGGWLDRLRYVWHPVIAGFPLLFAGFSLAGYGYLASRLAVRLFDSIWVVLGVVLIGGVLTRWVLMSRRRMLLAQLQHRAEQAKRDENRDQNSSIDLQEPSTVDVTQVSQQTLRLIRALLVVGGFAGMAWVWSSVLPALNVLDQIEVWETVTLTNLLLTIPIAVMTVVAVRNLPGLLETVILQHLPLESAARYAITTVSSYTLALIGIVVSARVLGLRWDSIQWLVAALGVGLGFGLQEIFANFISGLILLFEQPIRVGDVITMDGVTGVVSRIRIRATTVTNWDRQELIIPNKDLITGRLLNWTLSDSMNRIVIKVGVGYETDTRKACQILEKILHSHPNLTREPMPSVAFEEFGNSSLILTIRAFLASLDVRLQTIHELHTQIHEAFVREGIEIAFPQQEIRVRSMPREWTVRNAA